MVPTMVLTMLLIMIMLIIMVMFLLSMMIIVLKDYAYAHFFYNLSYRHQKSFRTL